MKTWKLTSGIICCVLSVMVLFQSCAASIGEAITETNTNDGGAGMIVAALMLAGGIVSIATHKNKGRGGNIAVMIIFALAALLGFSSSSYYKDLAVWAFWCLVCFILAIVAMFRVQKSEAADVKQETEKQ